MAVKAKGSKKAAASIKQGTFYQRWNIELDMDDAREIFMNRVDNRILDRVWVHLGLQYYSSKDERELILFEFANALGQKYVAEQPFDFYYERDYLSYLLVIEALYSALRVSLSETSASTRRKTLTTLIRRVLDESEVDLQIDWQNGVFVRKGARLLDEELVNRPLDWLSEMKYETVHSAFSKGLTHFAQAEKRPELLSDVVTDMYESLEALAKIVTGKNRDLSANRELFISTVKASDAYIVYANEFRHAPGEGTKRPRLSVAEVESFIYLTGVFIRLAVVN
jgi:hypothetical protein